jgi:phosphatidate cytidylyltransferase
MAVIFAIAISLPRLVLLAFAAFICYLALKEYLSLIPLRKADRGVLLWTYMANPLQYLWVAIEWYGMFVVFIPVYMFLFLPARMLFSRKTAGFLRSTGTLHWGLMMMVYSLSHAAYLLAVPGKGAADWEGAGLLLYLVILTQLNDVAQYAWGKLVGRRKIVWRVSPEKTWEGLIGGVITTAAIALFLAPLLTPFDTKGAIASGAIIAIAGFFGAVTIASLKRDLGIRDFSGMLPGHGGIIDRVDSLIYAAPLFLHFTWYFYY